MYDEIKQLTFNQWVRKEITRDTRNYCEINENESTT